MAKSSTPDRWRIWIEARNRFRLNHIQVQMARELGMNPTKLGKLDNSDQEPWKAPLPEYIQHLYRKRFGRETPMQVRSIEEMIRGEREKKEAKRARKEAQAQLGLGIAWYSPDQWDRLLELSEDRDQLERTHAQWLVGAESLAGQLASQGATVRKVSVDVDDMHAWCREKDIAFNGAGRAKYVTWLLSQAPQG